MSDVVDDEVGRFAQAAQDAAARRDWQTAEASWRRCIMQSAKASKAAWHLGFATALQHLERYDEADAAYAHVRERWPNNPRGWIGAAYGAAAREDWAAAEALWTSCIARFDDAAAANWWVSLSHALQQQGRSAEARDACRTAQQRFPEESAGWVGEARIASACGDWTEAEELWRQCILRFRASSSPFWFESLARALAQQGRFVDAERVSDESECRDEPIANDGRVSARARTRRVSPGSSAGRENPQAREPETTPMILAVVMSLGDTTATPSAIASARRVLEHERTLLIIDQRMFDALGPAGIAHRDDRLIVVDTDASPEGQSSAFLSRVALAAHGRADFVYFNPGTSPPDIESLVRFGEETEDLKIFGAVHPYRFDRNDFADGLAGARGIGVDLFHLLHSANIMIGSALLSRIADTYDVSVDQIGAAALALCDRLAAHDLALPGQNEDAPKRVQSLCDCYTFFLANDPAVAERIVDFVANPRNCHSIFRGDMRPTAIELLVTHFSKALRLRQKRSRDIIPLHFQEGWCKAIAARDTAQLIGLAERIARDDFFEVPRRQVDADDPVPPTYIRRETSDGLNAVPPVTLDYSATAQGRFGQHRDGWEFVLQNVAARIPHDPTAVGLDAFAEKTFAWEYGNRSTLGDKPWIAITHKPTEIPEFYGWRANMEFYGSPYFFPRSRSLKAIVALEETRADFLRSRFDVPVYALWHPTNLDVPKWSPDCLGAGTLRLIQIGRWLRRLHSIFLLPTGPYRKCILAASRDTLFTHPWFRGEGLEIQRHGSVSGECYDTVDFIEFLDNAGYDALLGTSIVFLDLYSSTANNTVVECIARHTPIVARRMPSTEQYLGSGYPLLFDTLAEAADLAADRNLLLAAHEYLVRWSQRREFRVDTFANEIAQIARTVAGGA